MDKIKLLFIDACQRGEKISRTYRLAEAFLSEFEKSCADSDIEYVTLRNMELRPLNGIDVIKRDELIDAGLLDGETFKLAWQFAKADRILIAAPFWDLMFPAALKNYIEHIMVSKVTFVYNERGPVGLCAADKLAYLTTSGSPMGNNNLGTEYIRSLCSMLGIGSFSSVAAEGLDIVGWDADEILRRACEKAACLGAEFANKL